jgi:hypothetical protein
MAREIDSRKDCCFGWWSYDGELWIIRGWNRGSGLLHWDRAVLVGHFSSSQSVINSPEYLIGW